MTYALTARNPNEAFPMTVRMLRDHGVRLPSRNGDCLEFPDVVSVTFTHPLERVLTNPLRRINPFLHFFEPLWILAGRRDVGFLAQFAKNMTNYSDDGENFAAAYGHRIRHVPSSYEGDPDIDQIYEAVVRLKADPDDRRVVLMIRQPLDIGYTGKDAACNIAASLKIRGGRLNMHVMNRSNDAVWGGPAGGTNHPQFTVLLEFMAGMIGCEVGRYTITTDSMHAYVNPQWEKLRDTPAYADPYQSASHDYRPFPMMEEPVLFCTDLTAFFETYDDGRMRPYSSVYFRRVVLPMWETFLSYKARDGRERELLERVAAADWQDAVSQWFDGIERLQRPFS